MTTFYICRHGQSEYNLQKKLQGQIDTPLTKVGIENAYSIANKLRGINFDFLLTSDLGRAFHTAYLVSKELELTNKIETVSDLRETNFGDLSGKRIEEVEKIFPGFMGNIDFVPPNGESLRHMRDRILNLLNNLESKYPNKTILLVSHDTVINAIYTTYANIDFGKFNETNYYPNDYVAKFELNNHEINSFEKF